MAVTRRILITQAVGFGFATTFRGCNETERPSDDEPQSDVTVSFDHGLASGDPGPDRVILWTRVTVDPRVDIDVSVEVAQDEAFERPVAAATATATLERDHTVKVDVLGLEPATTYFYRFSAGGRRST